MPRSIVAAAVLAAGTAFVVYLPAATASSSAARPVVTGFQSADSPVSRIDASARALAVVAVDGVTLADSGATVPSPDRAALAQRARARQRHLRAEFVVSNFSDAVGDFSEPLAWRLLGYAAHRRAVAARLAAAVRQQGWDGVNVDLESLGARDRAGVTDFLRQLRAHLPRGRTLSVDLMVDTTKAAYARMGYDVPAISATVDRVVLMTYDEHGPWEDVPGPVGGLDWTQKCLAAALAAGAPRSKVDLGVAGYGYAWRPHSNDTLSVAQARRLATPARARWNAAAGEWTARLPDGSTLWWSDVRSYRARYAYAAAHHLHGVAVWSLGEDDPLPAP